MEPLRARLPEGTEETSVLSVSEVTDSVKELLEGAFPDVWIRGEASNVRRPSSGHIYFTLKDAEAQLKAVLFRGAANRSSVLPEDGMELTVQGSLTVYAPRGDYQIVVSRLRPSGRGALYEAYEKLKARLAAEGLFEEGRKKEIPRLPGTVGVVTSGTGAAFQDILNVVHRRFQGLRIVLRPCKVQGAGAAEDIAAGVRAMDQWGGADVLIVGRGGGSIEDLWAFNEETVARAIAECETPVISAVGHDIDVTISDLVADLRAPTPSAAAELVVGEREQFLRRLDAAGRRLRKDLATAVQTARSSLEAVQSLPSFARPLLWLSPRVQALDGLSEAMDRRLQGTLRDASERLDRSGALLAALAPRTGLRRDKQRLDALSSSLCRSVRLRVQRAVAVVDRLDASLAALNPLAVLDRGFCVAYGLPERRLLTKAAQAEEGGTVSVVLADGAWNCEVKKVVIGTKGRIHGQKGEKGV